MTAELSVSEIRISNILGIKSLVFKAGRFNEIAGPNEVGKTSALEAIRAVLKGGNDATLLRKGEDKGEVVFVLSDETMIRHRVGVGQGTTVERHGVREKEPRSYISDLFDITSANPIAFMEAPDKQRVSILLDSIPMQADPDRVRSIIGDIKVEFDATLPALAMIESVHKAIFADRRDTNRAFVQKESAITQLAATLPQGDGSSAPGEDEADLKLRLSNLDEAYEKERQRIADKLAGITKDYDTCVEVIRNQIAALQAMLATGAENMRGIESRAAGQREISKERYMEQRAPTQRALEAIQGNRDAAVRAETTKGNMRVLRAEADVLQDDAAKMTKSLAGLEAYKSELLKDLPAGLTVEDGVVMRNGVVFDRLNEAQQIELAFEVAKLRAGKLGIVCIDGIERIVGERYEAFKATAIASGLQLFVTRAIEGGESLQINQD